MDTKKVKEFIRLIETTNLTVLEVCEGEVRIRLEKNAAEFMNLPVQTVQSQSITSKVASTFKVEPKSEIVDFNKLNEVRSPLIGIYYASPSPNSSPFVMIGKKVKKGDVLCIVEAMKQMNEITADVDGEIADVCVKNGDIVEYNQVLFKIY